MGRTIRRHGCAGYVYDIVAVHRDDPLLDGVIVASEGRRASRDAKSQVSAVASPGA